MSMLCSARGHRLGESDVSALRLWVMSAAILGGVAFLPATAGAQAGDIVVYDEALQNGFSTDYSYGGGLTVGSTAQAHSGTHSIALTGNGTYNTLAFTNTTMYSTATYPVLHFWIYGASPGGQKLDVQVYADKDQNGGPTKDAPLDTYISGGAVGSGVWREVTVDLTQPPLSFDGTFNRIDIQTEASQAAVYIDDVSLQSPADDEIFANGFDSGSVTPALVEDHDVTVLSMLSDRFTWRDAANQPRVAVLAHNDAATAGPGGTRGGELRQFQYQVGAITRTVNASGNGASGFGYVVSHPNEDGANCTNGKIDNTYDDPYDTSLLGHTRGGTWSRVFEGRHHAIFRFTTTYPRYCSTSSSPPAPGYLVPVTIDWSFSTGRDNALWSITWDLSAVPVNVLEDDSRAPYGELLFDGSASEGAHSVIAGVGWGDRYKFTTTSSPATYQSTWTWNVANTVPYVTLWTTAVDATMGTVQTQPIAQQDAGGYFGSDRWNTTSGSGNACAAGDDAANAHLMPCSFNWDYQSINYSLDPSNPSSPTNNTRLAWGTEFGFLGQSAYHINGSNYWGGPLADATAPGYPKKSYSVYVVFGVHSTDAVAAQVTQVEDAQTVALSATTGSVATSGPAGVNRTDTITYSPAGYDPVYGALVFNASGNAVTGTINVSSGTLKNPMLIIRNYTSGSYPSAIIFGGTTLAADVDYFASLRSDKSELWITLNRQLAGSNALQITP